MKNIIIVTTLASSIFLTGCGESETKTGTPVEQETASCLLSLNNESVAVNWTAYKFTERAGVGGSFDSIAVSGVTDQENIIDAVTNATFEIYTSSVNSNNAERDVKISNSFFGTMANTQIISGTIVSLLEHGSGVVSLKINDNEQQVPIVWEMTSENRLKLITTINIPDWEAQASLDSLNNVCSLLHTGTDGVSVLWPDIDIEVIADFEKVCE